MRYKNPEHQKQYERLVTLFQEAVIHTVITGEHNKQSSIDLFLYDLYSDAESCLKKAMENK